VRPDGYIEPGIQQLSGEQALAFARSRTGTTDYARMGRQRCLLQNILSQKSPAVLLTNFQSVAAATTNSVSTNIPQAVLPALAALAGGDGGVSLESVSFDPNLPDPSEDSGRFNTGDPNFPYMREVVEDAINRPPPPPAPTGGAPASRVNSRDDAQDDDVRDDDARDDDRAEAREEADEEDDRDQDEEEASAAPTSLAQACG
jgi:polyisoprenyl-teichoic acid--peptidoglycan teichoic acid transferase